ncbi:MAG TPA: protein translocase subunit SecD, partial [Thermomicrobiales bacterium]|nr:protein translocase subunit SecD [Thermomicrobiales bacterium]
ALLALASAWIALPTDVLNVGGFKDRYPVREGLDLQGGLQVVLQAQPVAGQTLDADALEGTRASIERRVNGLGVSEPLIQTRGSDQIIVELPGVEDPQQAVEILQETALLEIIDPQGQFLPPGTVVDTSLGAADRDEGTDPVAAPATPAAGDATPVAAAAELPEPAGPVYETIVSGADLRDAYPTTDATGFGQVVGFELQGEGADRFFQFTSTNLGAPMAIVIDKVVVSSPQIQGSISTQGSISGIPPQEVDDLVVQLKSGALNVPLEVVQSRTVGPTLGRDSIDRSIVAGGIGLAAVALFMVLYYRLPGVLSVVSLLIYTAITFAIFKLVPVTLTLAGIAGFILSIGMAVDANVLIFARLKEELRTGRPAAQAVELGFNHAWPSIRDSNITTMITTFILYLFGSYTGTSIITGFAITLFIGVAVSMFTAITATRTFMRLLVAGAGLQSAWLFGIRPRQSSAAAD